VIHFIHHEKALPFVLVKADLPKRNLKNSWPVEAAWTLVGGSEGLSWTSCIEKDLHLKILTIFSNIQTIQDGLSVGPERIPKI